MPISGIPSCFLPHAVSGLVRLGHGSGGKLSSALIENVFLPRIGNDILNELDDAALFSVKNATLAFTTDAYVVSPIFFPGGDIGSLAVHGTVNDLAMRGARPLYIAAAFILEEGFPINELEKIADSVQRACSGTQVQLIAADTKVVGKGAADKLFITTCGIGIVEKQPPPAANRARAGDCVLLSGDIGRHGVAIMSQREGLDLDTEIESDSAPLHGMVLKMLSESDGIHCLRDITRGGLAGVLNELARASSAGIKIAEDAVPVHPQVRAVCEILGLDALHVACEGRFVTICAPECAGDLLSVMKREISTQASEQAAASPAAKFCRPVIIGHVVEDHPGRVVLRSTVGGNRVVDKLSGEQLPRIC